MKNRKETIRKIVGYLNDPDSEGGFWLPNIQRPFVWDTEQICRLFDSILREYPISTLLVWKTKSQIRRRKFIDNWRDDLRLSDFYVPIDDSRKALVLDGQQRLQSLFIALKGSFNGDELHFDILSGEVSAPDDVKYQFEFKKTADTSFPWVRFKDLVFTEKNKRTLASEIKDSAGRDLTDEELDKIEDHLDLIDRTFKMDESITYQELDSIDNPTLYTEDDVVEVFIRANSGGTKLEKSDLLFSLLNATWDHADDQMEELLNKLNSHGFKFDRDFVLKTSLVLLDQGAKFSVDKFRRVDIRQRIESKWNEIAAAILSVLDFVRGKTYIQCDKAMVSYRALIPMIYLRYHFPDEFKKSNDLNNYLLRSLLTGTFSKQTDTVLDALVKHIRETKKFDAQAIFEIVRNQGRSIQLTSEKLLSMGYGSPTIHLLFNFWYADFNHTPAYENGLPQVDHIFPQSRLSEIKETNPKTGRERMKYRKLERDELTNCMLLTREENGAGGKSDQTPAAWFAGKDDAYLDRHLIPRDQDLWEMNRFEDFKKAREALILQRFAWLVDQQTVSGGDGNA